PTYPQWDVDPVPILRLLLAWAGVLLLAIVFWVKRTSWGRHGFFALGFFALILIPVLGFVPISFMRISWVADHFTHIPMLSLAGLVAAGGAAVERRTRHTPAGRSFAAFAAVMLFSTLAFLSHRQAGHWKDEETLWTYTLA